MSGYGVLVFAIVLQLLLALYAAQIAGSRGRSFVVYVISSASSYRWPAYSPSPTSCRSHGGFRRPRYRPLAHAPAEPQLAASDRTEQIDRLASLRERGHLTEEEFEREKARVLGASG